MTEPPVIAFNREAATLVHGHNANTETEKQAKSEHHDTISVAGSPQESEDDKKKDNDEEKEEATETALTAVMTGMPVALDNTHMEIPLSLVKSNIRESNKVSDVGSSNFSLKNETTPSIPTEKHPMTSHKHDHYHHPDDDDGHAFSPEAMKSINEQFDKVYLYKCLYIYIYM